MKRGRHQQTQSIIDSSSSSDAEMDVVDDDEEEKVEMMDEKEAGPEHYDSDSDERMVDKGEGDDDDDVAASSTPAPHDAPSPPPSQTKTTSSFLDSFYGLASPDPSERAASAQVLLEHCHLTDNYNTSSFMVKDSAYAFRRLLNGLCSGRAAARQGNASALAAFLKMASRPTTSTSANDANSTTTLLQLIQQSDHQQRQGRGGNNIEDGDDIDNPDGGDLLPDAVYVRNRLLQATEPPRQSGSGKQPKYSKKRGSEERDHQFGRLFGILAVVRSGTLLLLSPALEPAPSSSAVHMQSVAAGYCQDLAALYSSKVWMREPAAHAVGTLLNSFYSLLQRNKKEKKKKKGDDHTDANATTTAIKSIIQHCLQEAVVPLLLSKGDNDTPTTPSNLHDLFATYSAEQIAILLNIQSQELVRDPLLWNDDDNNNNISQLPPPMLPRKIDGENKDGSVCSLWRLLLQIPLLTPQTVPLLASALGQTSTVTQPRTHLVWDTVWQYLTEPEDDATNTAATTATRRRAAVPLLLGKASGVHEVLEALVRHVVLGQLLGISVQTTATSKGDGDNNNDDAMEVGDTAIIKAKENAGNSTNATHERRALALCLMRNASGCEFVSALTGRTVLVLDTTIGNIAADGTNMTLLETTVLHPLLVRRLLLDVIGAGDNKSNKKHLLRPLAMDVLGAILEAAVGINANESEENDESEDATTILSEASLRRLAIARAFLRSDPRFDLRTKTKSVAILLGMHEPQQQPFPAAATTTTNTMVTCRALAQRVALWSACLKFLEHRILGGVGGGVGDIDDSSAANASSSSFSSHVSMGYVDLWFHLGKALIRVEHDHDDSGQRLLLQRVFGFGMASAFYDCQLVAPPAPTSSKKKSRKKRKNSFSSSSSSAPANKDDSLMAVVVEAAMVIQSQQQKQQLASIPILPYDVRTAISARFFSLLAEQIARTAHSSSPKRNSGANIGNSDNNNKSERILQRLSDLIASQKYLEQVGASPLRKLVAASNKDEGGSHTNGDEGDDDKSPETVLSLLQDQITTTTPVTGPCSLTLQQQLHVGCLILASTLYLQLLSCGGKDNLSDEDSDPEDDDDDTEHDAEEITVAMNDILHVNELYANMAATADPGSKDDGVDESEGGVENPLLSLAELCINLLSSPLWSGSSLSRGSSPKLLREAVKIAWTGGLNASAALWKDQATKGDDIEQSPSPSPLTTEVVRLLLSSSLAAESGADRYGEDEEEEDEEDSNSDDDTGEFGDSGIIFSKAACMPEFQEDEDMEVAKPDKKPGSEEGKEEEEEEEESDVELDDRKLQSMLEEEDVSEGEWGNLEHHAGADGALAKLIQLKQEARKAGKMALEKVDLARRLRCTVLLETLLLGKPDGWGALLHTDVALQMIIPLLQYRRELEKALLAVNAQSGGFSAEKRALLDRLDALLKTKLLKLKFSQRTWSSSFSGRCCSEKALALGSGLASQLIVEVKKRRISKDQQTFCSSGLLTLLRAIPQPDNKLAVADGVYRDAVKEWSTQRTSRLTSTLFNDLIHHHPVIAQATLVPALAVAAGSTDTRSTFLKAESFRLLSLLYNIKLNNSNNDTDSKAFSLGQLANQRVVDAVDDVVTSVIAAIADPEMKKTKRIREVLKSMERVVIFMAQRLSDENDLVSNETRPTGLKQNLADELKQLLRQVKETSDSQGVANSCGKLLQDIDDLSDKVAAAAARQAKVPAQTAIRSGVVTLEVIDSESKKKKKKSKKKGMKKKRR